MDILGKKKSAKDDRKKLLCSELATAIRKLQEERVLTKEVKGDNPPAEQLCDVLEAVFLHELKNSKGRLWREARKTSKSPPEPSFWVFVDPLVSDEIKMQLYALRNSDSDIRKCRSWVRLMLSKGQMMSFLRDLQRHPGLLAFHYGGDAILRDPEQSEVVLQLLKGLLTFQLDYDYTIARLNFWDPPVLQLAAIWSPPTNMMENRGSGRISPPASDFDFEGISIIDLALNKYSKRKESLDSLTDSQLITNEHLEQLSNPSGGSSSDLDSEAPVGSYGAMLRSYARRTNSGKPQKIPGIAIHDTKSRAQTYSSTPSGTRGGEGEESEFALAHSLNYEIVTPDGSVVTSDSSESHQTMTAQLTKLVNEKGLDSQSYHCAGCRRPIGIIFGQAKLCKYNGQYYCFDCHLDDERVIPARVLFNWDFRKHKVSVASCEFLDSIEYMPVLNIEEVNKALYVYIPQMEEALKLRQELLHLKDYLLTCKDQDAEDQFRRRVRSAHFFENVHLYSIHDLMEVYSGTFCEGIRRAVKMGKKHVRQCTLCSQKGFICEVCHSDQVIYPFELETTFQCPSCSALFHKDCQTAKADCPKCLRIQKRRQATAEAENVKSTNHGQ